MNLRDKKRKLEVLEQEILQAPDFPLKKTARNLVFGRGSLNPKVFFIGEAPGAKEDEQGFPFVGMAGKQLDALLDSIGLTVKSVYITSILKYRPPKNRAPNIIEIKAHTPFLVDQIKIIEPKIVVTLGNFATKFVLGGFNIKNMSTIEGITQLHGEARTIALDNQRLLVIPTFHPAAIFYNRPLKKKLEKDFQSIGGHI
jgi:uracil-DNA glycosylase